LKEKPEAFKKFKEFKALVEKQNELCLKTLRLHIGGELTSNEFNDYCKKERICHQLTAGYTP